MNQLTNLFKTLSDETRLRIIALLFQEELCVCEISGILNIPQPTVSKGLSKLRDLNLVEDTRKEKFIYYKLKEDPALLRLILMDIFHDLSPYPQLLKDKEGLTTKWIYTDSNNTLDPSILLKK
ncbi:MAG TPA: transcriptional regulator [Clostridiaceae bacterium]|nr:transcriptional regulator [Clostridiaceae bacterium]